MKYRIIHLLLIVSLSITAILIPAQIAFAQCGGYFPQCPIVDTNPATDVAQESATLNGTLVYKGSFPSVDVYFRWGIKDSGVPNITTPEVMTTTGDFEFDLTGLMPDTAYQFVAFVDAGFGSVTEYGSTSYFTTLPQPKTTVIILVSLQGSGRPSIGWDVPINVGFYPANSGTLVMSGSSPYACYYFTGYTAMTIIESATKAYFVCPIQIALGNYDITIDSTTTLLNVKRNVLID